MRWHGGVELGNEYVRQNTNKKTVGKYPARDVFNLAAAAAAEAKARERNGASRGAGRPAEGAREAPRLQGRFQILHR